MNQSFKAKKDTLKLSKKRNISNAIKAILVGSVFIPSIAFADPNISVTADGVGNTATIVASDITISSIGLGYPDQSIYSAVYANGTNGANVDIDLNNVQISTNQMWHSGIKAVGANIDISVTGNSTITTGGWQGHGIQAILDNTITTPGQTINILNEANIIQTDLVAQKGTHGIVAQTNDSTNSDISINITNSGDITLVGYIDARGILILNENVTAQDNFKSVITNSGNITVTDGIGILSQSRGSNSNVTVNNSGNITSTYDGRTDVAINSLHGIEAWAANGVVTINHSGGKILMDSTAGTFGSSGIVAWGYSGNVPVHTEAYINVTGTASVDASEAGFGLEIVGQKGKIYIGPQADVMGGTFGAGLIGGAIGADLGTTAELELENEGTLGAASDYAISAVVANHNAILKNTSTGKITGYIRSDNTDLPTIFTNEGTWDLRNTYRSVDLANGTYVKDTQGIPVSTFGAISGLNGTITNTGRINLVGRDESLTLDTTGEYTPFGAEKMADGYSQAQILRVGEFISTGTGVIDLTGNNTSKGGNVLIISGSDTPGQDGNGTFYADGGSIYFNTVLNAGGDDSKSDMLVVDNTVLGSRPTELFVNAVAGSTGVKTVGNGIRLIEVTGSTQDAKAFTLGAPVTYGLYEYRLTSVTGQPGKNGYYLVNDDLPVTPPGTDPDPVPTPPGTEPEPTPPTIDPECNCTWKAPQKIINPNVGSIMGAQTAAVHLFNNLGRTFGHYNKSDRDRALWATMSGDHTRYTLFNGRLQNKINSAVLNVGVDIYANEEKTFIAGLYAGYGQSKIKTSSRQTGTRSEVETEGYTLGGYVLINALKDEGFYMNSWGYYGRFKNDFKGASFNQYFNNKTHRYNSDVLSINADIGYKIPLAKDDPSTWVVQPKVGLYYSDYRADTFTDYTLTKYSGNHLRGLESSVGARFYKARLNPEDLGVKPYVEMNWLHNTADNELKVNYEHVSQNTGKDAFELKIGATGKIAKNWDVFGYAAAQKGSKRYERYEGQLGLRYLF